MLRKRVIPIVLLDGFSVLKTINFDVRRNLGSPVTVLRTYNTRNVDELVLLDIDASKQRRSIDKFTIQDIAKECFMPLTVGGGICSTEDVRELLERGADKVAINTCAIQQPNLIKDFADIFGSQCIVVSIDLIEVGDQYKLYSNGKIIENLCPFEWMRKAESLGAGEILLNNVTRDGTMSGANIDLARVAADLVNIPVIYAGGISSPENSAQVGETGVAGVGVSSIFHFTDATPGDCRKAFRLKGLAAR